MDNGLKNDKMFDSLVRNALDFLARSVGEDLQGNPKYSVISFCTALELFFKSRLLKQHWALIYDDPRKADLSEFQKGNFKSVGMEDAIARLRKLGDLRITDEARNAFDEIREHRNRLIHFFHSAYADKPDDSAIQKVVAEQCRGWFYLHPLLTGRWRDSFTPYLSGIETIDRVMRIIKKNEFLRLRFDARSQGIETGKARGAVFSVCAACDYEAAKVARDSLAGPLFSVKCLVCDTEGRVFKIECPNCHSNTLVQQLFTWQPDSDASALRNIEVSCKTCQTLISFEDIINKNPSIEPNESPERFAFCGNDCRGSAVLFGDKWVCLSCRDVCEVVRECDGCGRLTTASDDGDLSCIACLEDEALGIPPPSEHVM